MLIDFMAFLGLKVSFFDEASVLSLLVFVVSGLLSFFTGVSAPSLF
jgi:hypothetical protein